jgi:hypothetical protein
MTAYAPSDVRSITIPAGCGQSHDAGDLAEGERFTVDCAECEPHILALAGHGWASNPLQVALTPDERTALEALERNAKAQQATTWSDPKAIGNAMAQALGTFGPAPAAPSLLEQIKALNAEEKAALVGLLTETPAEPAEKAAAVPAAKATKAAKAAPRKAAASE